MKVSVTQAQFERNLAVQQVTRLKQDIDQLSRDRHAVCLHCLSHTWQHSRPPRDAVSNCCVIII